LNGHFHTHQYGEDNKHKRWQKKSCASQIGTLIKGLLVHTTHDDEESTNATLEHFVPFLSMNSYLGDDNHHCTTFV
jgi:hypothetical protein